MIWLLLLAPAAWFALSLLLALVIGGGMRHADARELPRRECPAPAPPAVARHRTH